MHPYTIEKLDIHDYDKCSNIWNMASFPLTEQFRQEIMDGNRVVFIYKFDGEDEDGAFYKLLKVL